MPSLPRRPVDFTTYDEVLADLNRLQSAGYQQLGNWSLGQMSDHLAKSLHATIDSYGYMAPWPLRFVARRFLPGIYRKRRVPNGAKIPRRFEPTPDITDEIGAQNLTSAIDRWTHHTGLIALHPFFGELTRDQWWQLQLIHCAHHLSFLIPNASEAR